MVDLTIKTKRPITKNTIPTILTTFEVRSGHFPHYATPVSEYPGKHSAQRVPFYPSAHSPLGSHLGGIHPRHTLGFGHLMKLVEFSFFLQYPGLGPILQPPSHLALSFGQGLHSPGSFISTREYPTLPSHHMHFPTCVNFSPLSHCLSSTKKSNSIDDD